MLFLWLHLLREYSSLLSPLGTKKGNATYNGMIKNADLKTDNYWASYAFDLGNKSF